MRMLTDHSEYRIWLGLAGRILERGKLLVDSDLINLSSSRAYTLRIILSRSIRPHAGTCLASRCTVMQGCLNRGYASSAETAFNDEIRILQSIIGTPSSILIFDLE
jgi:hypothetical protein